MRNFDLHDFIEDYPRQEDNDIQWKTACRREFNELSSDDKKAKKKGNFFYHQELFLRYLRQYDKIFNIQGTGTGKSGSIINVAEFYKSHNEGIKRVYVLEPGPPTVEDFKSQIKKLSKPEEYTNIKIKGSSTARALKNNLNRLIKEWYSVETYQQFSKRKVSDEYIREEYSDCIFFLDEAHKLRNLEDGSGGEMSKEEKENIYQFLWRVCHIAERCKIIISTATPMINETKEFAYLLNFLLPMEQQLPIYGDEFYNRVTLAQLEPYLRGKITFIKFLTTNIDVKDQGISYTDYVHKILLPKNKNIKGEPLLPLVRKLEDNSFIDYKIPDEKLQPLVESEYKYYNSQTTIFPLVMKGIQLEVYLKTLSETANFFSSQRQSSVFVFPNGQIGNQGFNNYVEKDSFGNYKFKNKVTYRNKDKVLVSTKPLTSYFNTDNEENIKISLNNLEQFSCKFKFIIQEELNASRNEKPGNSFIYIEFVESSGAILLGLLLEIFGFEEYRSTISAFDVRTGKLNEISKKKRFAYITGKSRNTQSVLELFNSEQNKHGEYIQVIIASKTARDGINLKNTIRGYNATPGWHEAGMYQARSRIIRADSHDMLFEETGKPVKVKYYPLASVRENEEDILYNKGLEFCSIDVKNYLKSEEKNIKNKRIIRFMKQCAFDAYMNYIRNTSNEIIDFSAEADYEEKFYKIWKARGLPNNDKRSGMALNQGPNAGDYIYNTYNILYSRNDIDKVKAKLKEVLKFCNFITIENFTKILEKNKIVYSRYILFLAIYESIYNNETIGNYQNTLSFKIDIKGDLIYTKRDNYFKIKRLNTERDLYFNEKYTILKRQEEQEEGDILSNIYNELRDKDEAYITSYYIKTQDYEAFKLLLEDSLIRLRDNNLLPLNEKILKLFDNYYIVSDKPKGYLEAGQKALISTPKGQGRKRAEGSEAGIKKLDFSKIEPDYIDEKIYVHFYKSSEKTAFAITSILESSQRSIRVLSRNEFKDADIVEKYTYNYLFNEKYEKLMAPYKRLKYYGTYIYRGGEEEKYVADKEKNFFRIVDNSNPRNKGIVCRFITSNKIILGMIKYFDDEGKYKDYYEGKVKVKKGEICDILLNIFREKNLLFTSF